MNINRNILSGARWCVATLLVALCNVTIAASGQLLQDIEYIKINKQNAIKLIFSEPVRYISHFPTQRSKEVSVSFDTLRPDDSLEIQNRVQTLALPQPNTLPVLGIGVVIEEASKKLIVRFTEPVVFAVSQISGSSSITISIEATSQPPTSKPAINVIPKITTGTVADDVIEKYMDAGRKALTKDKNSDAIQIFSKVLSMPKNKYSQEALELLGVARERNNQIAHAKAIYQQYLKLYEEGEGPERVKQRFADLIAGQLSPREKLKPTDSSKSKNEFQHRLIGALSQYYYYGQNSVDEASSTGEQKLLISQISVNHRMRSTYTDIRNFIFINHENNFVDQESENPEISSLYSKIKNSKHGLYFTVGRQSAATAGVLGRFDGLLFGYDINETTRVNVVGGFPVDISDKTKIQTDKEFYAINIELNNLWKDWNITPYLLQQTIDGIPDREVIGSEVRYFSKAGNFFGTVDYDTMFDELNIFMFRSQYNINDKSIFLMTLDYRKSPLLEAGNALIGDSVNETVGQLSNSLSEDEIIDRAKDRTGDSSTISLGMNNRLTPDMQFNYDITYAQQTFKIVDLSGNTSEGDDDQMYFSAQLIFNKIFNHQDTTILDLRQSQTSIYDETQLSVSHRIPLESKLRIQSRLYFSKRDNISGEKLDRIKPSINLNYRSKHSVNYISEISYEWWKYGGNTDNNDYKRLFINLGYQWLF